MKRLYNTHPTQAFVRFYNGKEYIFQPDGGGTWALKKEQVPAKTRRGKAAAVNLVLVDKISRAANFLDVPDELAKIVLEGDMRECTPGIEDGIDAYHHGGFIKELEALQASIDAELDLKKKRMAHLDEMIMKKEAEANAAAFEAGQVAVAAKKKGA